MILNMADAVVIHSLHTADFMPIRVVLSGSLVCVASTLHYGGSAQLRSMPECGQGRDRNPTAFLALDEQRAVRGLAM